MQICLPTVLCEAIGNYNQRFGNINLINKKSGQKLYKQSTACLKSIIITHTKHSHQNSKTS